MNALFSTNQHPTHFGLIGVILTAVLNAPDNAANQLFTFRSDSPNRLLDHIYLFGKSLQFVDFRVVNKAGTAFDHLPVMAKIRYQN
jgi:endonuclease/exonuclease/phosphatase family metal-dependent hydrolase